MFVGYFLSQNHYFLLDYFSDDVKTVDEEFNPARQLFDFDQQSEPDLIIH